jgi:hypothetical protein
MPPRKQRSKELTIDPNGGEAAAAGPHAGTEPSEDIGAETEEDEPTSGRTVHPGAAAAAVHEDADVIAATFVKFEATQRAPAATATTVSGSIDGIPHVR